MPSFLNPGLHDPTLPLPFHSPRFLDRVGSDLTLHTSFFVLPSMPHFLPYLSPFFFFFSRDLKSRRRRKLPPLPSSVPPLLQIAFHRDLGRDLSFFLWNTFPLFFPRPLFPPILPSLSSCHAAFWVQLGFYFLLFFFSPFEDPSLLVSSNFPSFSDFLLCGDGYSPEKPFS